MFLQSPFKKRFGLLAGVFAVGLLVCSPLSDARTPTALGNDGPVAQSGLPEVQMRLGKQIYQLEKASTPEQEEKGLMYRTRLPRNHGMLFLFQPPHAVSFWMKNTKIPLDIVFLSQGKVVYVEPNAPPCPGDPCNIYGSGRVVDMVVELPAGTAQRQGIQPGMTAALLATPLKAHKPRRSKFKTSQRVGK
jgi:uncharacterized membrane protein (UPF0127 family)